MSKYTRIVRTSKRFRKDYKKIQTSSNKKIDKLDKIMKKLINIEKLDPKYNDHPLKGDWKNFRDCHIEGDWILIYKLDQDTKDNEIITFHATDNHSNLFK